MMIMWRHTQFSQSICALVVGLMFMVITCNVAHTQNDPRIAVAMDWSIDGVKLAVGYQGGAVEIIDVRSGEVSWKHQFFRAVTSLMWHPADSDQLAISGGNPARAEGVVQIWDVMTNQVLLRLNGGESVTSISWSPDGTKLVTASNTIVPSMTAQNELRIWDTTTGELLIVIPPVSSGNINVVAWQPDGRKIAGATTDNLIAIWDANSGEVLQILQGHSSAVLSLTWSHDGGILASTSFGLDNTLRVWDTATWQSLATFPTNFSTDAVWSPLANELAIAESRAIRILDAATGDELATFPANGLQQAVAYTPYGGQLAFGGEHFEDAEGATLRPGDTVRRKLSDGAVWVVIPAPSLDRLNAIAALCVRDGNAGLSSVQALAQPAASIADLPAYIARVEALPADAIPPACRADLLAVAGALLAGE